ncbi:glycosyltransferase family 4 protein [uncultured Roseobacter sp.]|uniref:glycosyltransferase family 4 protein n=1 Tax=uncultured Roseobacter sp. TaxID=114847 RepID=UPI00260D519A|nr:glycosyltransferase family 4 protein [uncultured Roseobacter sp.]
MSPFTSLAGGVRVMAIYAAELQARGHEVTVVSMRHPTPPLKLRIRAMMGRAKLRPVKKSTPLLDVLGANHVVVNHNGPITAADVPDGDVVIATWWETAPWVADLPASKGRKFYLLQDYETFKKGRFELVSATYDLPLRKIAVSDYIARMLAENHDIQDVAVVPNSVDCTQFSADPREKGPGLTAGFLYTGKTRKNVKLAIDVLAQAREVIPGLKVIAFGSIAPLDKLPLPDWIEYHRTPAQAELAKIYASCDVWLFTSLHEGFGLPILEAMACGTPVLATPAGGAPQIVTGSNGTLLSPEPEAFLAELQRMASLSPEAWRKMSDAARETAHAYSWGDATDRLLEALREEAPA